MLSVGVKRRHKTLTDRDEAEWLSAEALILSHAPDITEAMEEGDWRI